PIISSEQFRLVEQRLASNRQGAMRSTTHAYLLRGLVSCGACRLACTGRITHGDQAQYGYYVCRGKREPVPSPCRARYIPVTELDALVWEDLCQVLQTPGLVRTALDRAQNG